MGRQVFWLALDGLAAGQEVPGISEDIQRLPDAVLMSIQSVERQQ